MCVCLCMCMDVYVCVCVCVYLCVCVCVYQRMCGNSPRSHSSPQHDLDEIGILHSMTGGFIQPGGSDGKADLCTYAIYTYIMHRHMAASSLRHHPPTGLPLKHYCQRGRGCQHKEQCVWRLVWLQLYCCLRSYHLGESFRSHVSASKPKKESQAKPEQDS